MPADLADRTLAVLDPRKWKGYQFDLLWRPAQYVGPTMHAAVKTAFVLFAWASLAASLVLTVPIHRARWPFFFTHLSFVGLLCYLTATWLLLCCSRYAPRLLCAAERSTVLNVLIQTLYSTSWVNQVIVTSVYWSLLFDSSSWKTGDDVFLDLSLHLAALLMIVGDFAINRMYVRFVQIVPCIAVSGLYYLWIWLGSVSLHMESDSRLSFFPYQFLRYSNPHCIWYYLGIPAFGAAVFCVVYLAHRARRALVAHIYSAKRSPADAVSNSV